MAVKMQVQSRGARQDTKNPTMRVYTIMAVVALVLLLIGTFVDLPLDTAIYAPGAPLVVMLSTLGLLPLSLPLCVFLGALAACSLMSKKAQLLKWLGCGISVACAALVGFLFIRSIFSVDGLGALFSFKVPTLVSAIIGIPAGIGLAATGFLAIKKSSDNSQALRILVVVLALALSFLFVEIFVKSFMMRPRYRTLVLGYEGVEFHPWYRRCTNAKELMATYGIDKNGFSSFPSTHTMQAATFITSFYGLSLIWPKLREMWRPTIIAASVVLVVVMICRMILGAHFLSDVSVGGLIGILFGMGVQLIEARIRD